MDTNDWQIASAIATILQAIVVVISLYFIWRQIQQQTRQMEQQTELTRIANTQSLVSLSSPLNLELIKDPGMARFWIDGAKEFATYNNVDQYRYKSLLIWWLIFHENIFYQHQKHLLDEGIYASWNYDLTDFVQRHNLKLHWAELRPAFQADFTKHIDSLIKADGSASQVSHDPQHAVPRSG